MTPSVPSEPMNRSRKRVAGHVLHALVAGPEHLAVGQHDLQAHDVIARDAVFEPAQAAGVLGHVAADGGDLHRAGIGRIEQPRGARGIGDRLRRGARLDQQGQVGAVQLQDLVHLRQAKHDAVRAGQAAAAQAGAGAARDDGCLGLVGQLQHAGDLLRGPGEHDAARHLLQRRGAVEGVGDEVFLLGEDILGAQETPQFGKSLLRE